MHWFVYVIHLYTLIPPYLVVHNSLVFLVLFFLSAQRWALHCRTRYSPASSSDH